jgi:hypothetical protein
MTSMEEQLRCFYLDGEFKPASDMLRKCVGDENSPYRFNCEEDPMKQVMPEDVKETARMNDISIQRGFASYNVNNYNIDNYEDKKDIIIPKLKSNHENMKPIIKPIIKNLNIPSPPPGDINTKEGYANYSDRGNIFATDTGLGSLQLQDGKCPDGYAKCPITGRCVQKCIGCVYRDNMKSREFNEADPCFPEGVYDGIDNYGNIKCTCGKDNRYCSDSFTENIFTADGMMMMGKKIIMNTGLTNGINDFFGIGQL